MSLRWLFVLVVVIEPSPYILRVTNGLITSAVEYMGLMEELPNSLECLLF